MHSLSLRSRQLGSGLIWVVTLTLMFLFAALIIDGSRIAQEQRRLQSMANALASKMSDRAQTCFGGELPSDSAGLDTADAVTQLQQMYRNGPEAGFAEAVRVVRADRVLIEPVGGLYTVTPIPDQARSSNGVAVELERPVGGLLGFAMGPLTAKATVQKEIYASFYPAGSTLSIPGGQNNLLGLVFNHVLGTNLTLDSVSFNDLQNTLIDLESLLLELVTLRGSLDPAGGLLGLGELLKSDAPGVAVREILKAVSTLVEGTQVAPILDELLKGVGLDTNLKLTDVIHVIGEGALDSGARVPLVSLLSSVVMNLGKQLGDINLNLGLPSLPGQPDVKILDLKLQLAIDEAPAVIIAPARMALDREEWLGTMTSSDIKLRLDFKLDLIPNSPVRIELAIPLELSTGFARAQFVGATCASGHDNNVDLTYDIQRALLTLQTFNEGITAQVGLRVNDFRSTYGPLCGLLPVCWKGYDIEEVAGKPGWCIGRQKWYQCVPNVNEDNSIDLNALLVRIHSNPVDTGKLFEARMTIRDVSLSGDMPNKLDVDLVTGSSSYSGFNEQASCEVKGDSTIECRLSGNTGEVVSGSITALLEGIRVEDLEVLGLPLEGLVQTLVNSLNAVLVPVLGGLSEYVLGPLLDAIGIQLGNAKLHVLTARQPAMMLLEECGIGTCARPSP